MSQTIRSVLVHQTGGPDVMRLESVPLPEPGPGEVRIRVAAAGVNFIDTYFRGGEYPRPLPFGQGLEGAGKVDALGDGVFEFALGDRVAWSSVPGSYAEALCAPAASLVKVPEGVDSETAAAAMLQGMTAHYLVYGVREPTPGDTALVHAAAGGTGLVLTQMLCRAGVRVIGTCGSAEKAALAHSNGCDEVIRYDEEDFSARTRELTGGSGVHVAYDGVGQATFEGSLAALRPRGLMCLFGQASGAVPPFDPGRLNGMGSLFLTRPSLFHYTADRAELEMRAKHVLDAIAQGELEIRIGARFPLAEAPAAHRALEGRETTGKVLLVP